MQERNIIMEKGKLSEERHKSEKEKATNMLKDADEFVLIVIKGTHNECLSSLSSRALPFMLFNIIKLKEKIQEAISQINQLRKIDKEM